MDWIEFIAIRPVMIDGRKATGPLMRRKTSSGWEYRPMTPDEQQTYLRCDAW